MADNKHVKVIRQGTKAWNKWLEKNPKIEPKLSGVDLRNAILPRVDLSGADLSNAILSYAGLIGANLSGANLIGADLSGADLPFANIINANLINADLSSADLRYANFTSTSLISANLMGANLMGANLIGTDLRGANLKDAIFIRTDLRGANLSDARISWTIFADIYLDEVKGLGTVRHYGPSTIGIDTLYQSGGKIGEFFLRGCGVPAEFIDYIESRIRAQQSNQFYSCFISHSTKDNRFCERLYADLQANKVRVWYFPEDAKWGEPVWGEIDKSIKGYDKLVVICSENSLQSGPVLREIQRALNREDSEHRHVLFPICIDDYIFKTWEHERKDDVLSKVVGDFTGWHISDSEYVKAFNKLLVALQAPDSKV